MSKISYDTRILFKCEKDKQKIIKMLEDQRFAWNECSKVKFNIPTNSIVLIHAAFYRKFRDANPLIPAQVVISAEQSVLSAYRSIKSCKHKIFQPPIKKKLSIRLDARSYSHKKGIFSVLGSNGRVKCSLFIYPKLQELIIKYKFCDPLIFARNGDIWMALTFNIPEILPQNKLAIGIDLGCRINAATSEGKLYIDKKFNKEKRALRYLKDCLKSKGSKGSKSARRHLKILRRKEANKSKNFSHNLANYIIKDTQADTLVLENLKSLKVKKHKYQNKNRISQVPMAALREILTYKALLFGKQVITVSPSYTSQIDHRTGKRDGERVGGRYIGKDGQLLHADVNAACNIGLRSKLPCSIGNYFAWQANVNSPIVGGSHSQAYLK